MAETSSAAAVTVAVAEPEHVTVNVVTSGPAPAAEKTPAATASEAKPAAAANPDPAKPSKAEVPNPSPTSGSTFQGKGDDFYNTIFYFSGMGSVIGCS